MLINATIYSQDATLRATDYYNKAQKNITDKDFDMALLNLSKAHSIAKNNNSPKKIQGEYLFLAGCVSIQKKDDYNALKFFLEAEHNFKKSKTQQKLTETYFQIALIYFKSKLYNNSVEYFIKTLHSNTNYKKTDILNYIGKSYYLTQNYDSAMLYFNQIDSIANINRDTSEQIQALNNIIQINKKQKNYTNALENYKKILDIYSTKQNNNGIALTLNNIGYNYVLLNNYKEAEKNLKQSLEYQNKLNLSPQTQAKTSTNIGVCLQNQNKIKEAIPYFLKAANIWEKLPNKSQEASTYNLIALIYFHNKDLYNAATYSKKSVQTAEISKNTEIKQNCYMTYSLILQNGNDYQNALEYYKKYLQCKDSILFNQRYLQHNLNNKILEFEKIEKNLKLNLANEEIQDILLTQLKLEKEKIDKENELLRKEQELQQVELSKRKYSLLIQKQQNEALLKEKEINDLENKQKLKDIELEKNKIETEKQQQNIALLKTEKEKQQLEIDKNKANKKFYKWILGLFCLILILASIFVIVTSRANKRLNIQQNKIQQQNSELNSQKDEIQSQADELRNVNEQIIEQRNIIEKRHRQITDSITYASKIQSAILPNLSELNKFFPENFIIFKPRDIVSGDFYWIKKVTNNKTPALFFAVADCTGHGVPGAFVSMLGISFLNEIVSKNQNITPGEILNKLRKEIKTSLKQNQEDNETKDGMDIALCKFNKTEKKLSFAGAFNPMYILRNKKIELPKKIISQNEQKIRLFDKKHNESNFNLYEIKADLQPIGIYHVERPFTNIEINVFENDRIYIFSDGYIDQFGGKNKQKYQSLNFKKKILQIQKLNMNNQKEELNDEYKKWTSGKIKYKQLDDILIMGLKI